VRELDAVGMQLEPGRLEIFPAIRPPDQGDFTSIGVRGCYLSHLDVLREALRKGAKRVLVMEDDVAISPRLPQVERALVDALSSMPWGIVYFGHHAANIPASSLPLVRSYEMTICAHFYGISDVVLADLVKHLEAILSRPAGHPDGGPMHYDGALATFRTRNPGHTLFASPNLAWQRNSRSDIADARWFDRIPVARVAVAKARTIRNRWNRWRQTVGT